MQITLRHERRTGWIHTVLIAFLCLLPFWSFGQDGLTTIPPSEGPLEVHIGYGIINITDINEKEETIDFDGALLMRWKDERLAYHPSDSTATQIDYTKVPEVSYRGQFSVSELYEDWRPFFYIPNGAGNRNTTNQAVHVWPDGTVLYQELLHVKVESPMDMRLYPFDQQNVKILFQPGSYSREELVFVPDSSLSLTWDHDIGIADWKIGEDSMLERERVLKTYDGRTKTISEFVISLHVIRKPMNIIISIIFPMVLLISLTWVVFWLDKQSVTDRINILFIGILSVVAYYFVIQDSVPEISYLTLMDVFVIVSFLILAASVVVTLIIGKLDQAGKSALGDKLDRICRWAFPLIYVVVTVISYIGFRTLAGTV